MRRAVTTFRILTYTPLAHDDAALAIAGSRAGGIGVFNAQAHGDTSTVLRALRDLARHGKGDLGLRLPDNHETSTAVLQELPEAIQWVVTGPEHSETVDADSPATSLERCQGSAGNH